MGKEILLTNILINKVAHQNMKTILQLIILLVVSLHVHAQETCTEKLYRASILYEKGQIDEAINIAVQCTNEQNISERWQAYRLLALCQIVNQKNNDARKFVQKMMEINPTYQASKTKDPLELTQMIKSFKIIPKFTAGLALNVGGNITLPNLKGTFNGADYQKKYTANNSWQMGVSLGYNLNEIISINSGLLVSNKKFSINYSVEQWDISIKENITYMNIPLYAKFTSLPINKFSGFIDVGGYVGRLVNANTDFIRSTTSILGNFSNINLSSENRRNRLDYGFLYGIGAMYNLGKVNLALDVRYYLSYANITNTENRYNTEELFYNYYFIDDDLQLDNLAISFSVNYNINYKIVNSK